jgi:hypothetical protein
MAYRSHHCSTTLHCSVCISVFYTLLVLSILFPLCSLRHVPSMHHFPSVHFYYCTLPPSSHLNHPQPQQPQISSLLCILIVSVQLVHAFSPCLCMLYPCRVLCLIIISTLQLLWQFDPCVHHHWVLS